MRLLQGLSVSTVTNAWVNLPRHDPDQSLSSPFLHLGPVRLCLGSGDSCVGLVLQPRNAYQVVVRGSRQELAPISKGIRDLGLTYPQPQGVAVSPFLERRQPGLPSNGLSF